MTNIHSMTGYGKAELSTPQFSVQVELRSVNNRFLDFQFRTPKTLFPVESQLRSVLEEYFTRGSISCNIQLELLEEGNAQLQLQQDVLKQYRGIIEELKGAIPVPTTMDLSTFLKNPDLVVAQQPEQEVDAIWKNVEPALREACEQMVEMRNREGQSLNEDMHTRLSQIQVHLKEIKEHLPQRQRECEQKLRTQIQEWLQEAQAKEERILTELGVLAEKMDVSEEVVRFESHIQLFLETVDTHKTPGKRLGFILQEMVRETNTLSTKALYSPIQHLCVYIKEELEKLREQTQNIE